MYGPDGDAITNLEPGPGRGKEALLMLYDAEIRDPLVWFLEEKYGKIRILDEIPIGKSRADMLLVTENWLAGIEIKSDMDSYARLMSQVQSYDRYLDRNILVVGASHEKSAVEHVPEYWGIIAARGTRHRISFSVVREPEVNPRMRDRSKLELLWKRELQNLVRKKNGRGAVSRFSKETLRKKVLETYAHDELVPALCDELFERDYTQQ